jgi:hypothetical protein
MARAGPAFSAGAETVASAANYRVFHARRRGLTWINALPERPAL